MFRELREAIVRRRDFRIGRIGLRKGMFRFICNRVLTLDLHPSERCQFSEVPTQNWFCSNAMAAMECHGFTVCHLTRTSIKKVLNRSKVLLTFPDHPCIMYGIFTYIDPRSTTPTDRSKCQSHGWSGFGQSEPLEPARSEETPFSWGPRALSAEQRQLLSEASVAWLCFTTGVNMNGNTPQTLHVCKY